MTLDEIDSFAARITEAIDHFEDRARITTAWADLHRSLVSSTLAGWREASVALDGDSTLQRFAVLVRDRAERELGLLAGMYEVTLDG